MDILISRAILGDRYAQKECTNKGIVLPCPKCYGKVKFNIVKANKSYVEMEYKCQKCGLTARYTQFFPLDENAAADKTALAQWNTRYTHFVGYCRDCIHYFQNECLKIYDDGACSEYARQKRNPDDYCSYFLSEDEIDSVLDAYEKSIKEESDDI